MRVRKHQLGAVVVIFFAALWSCYLAQVLDGEGANCTLEPSLVAAMRRQGTTEWFAEVALEQGIELQMIIECTSPGDVVQLPAATPIIQPRRLVVPWNLTIGRLNSRDASVDASQKAILRCPAAEQLIRIESLASLALENVIIESCHFAEEAAVEAVIQAVSAHSTCREGESRIELRGVVFRDVHNSGGAFGLVVSRPHCFAVVMERVEFSSVSYRDASTFGSKNTLRDVQLRDVSGVSGAEEAAFSFPVDSDTEIIDMTAHPGQLATLALPALLHVNGGRIRVTDSSFFDFQDLRNALVYFESAGTVGIFEHTLFRNNRAELGGSSVRVWQAKAVEFEGCIFDENAASPEEGSGGAVWIENAGAESGPVVAVTFRDCTFAKNAAFLGGAVYAVQSVRLSVEKSLFSLNAAEGSGGALYTTGDVEVRETSFAGNRATYGGGAISADGKIGLTNSVFSKNQAGTSGGAFSAGKDVLLYNCAAWENRANGNGGAIFGQGDIFSSGSLFSDNKAGADGGALASTADIFLSETEFTRNSAGADGGGAIAFGNFQAEDSHFYSNDARKDGGGIRGEGDVYISRCSFTNNSAAEKGGAATARGEFTVEISTFEENEAGDDGGALNAHEHLFLFTCTFRENFAEDCGGGAAAFGDLESAGCVFLGNLANTTGGGLYAKGDINIRDSKLEENRVTGSGGGAFSQGKIVSKSSAFFRNEAGARGGGLRPIQELTIEDCEFEGNLAESGGAALSNANVTVVNSRFRNNKAAFDGGAVVAVGVLRLEDCSFADNAGLQDGGAALATVELISTRCKFEDNSAAGDGGTLLSKRGIFLKYSSFSRNSAKSKGGAVYGVGFVEASHCDFEDSSAGIDGGAIYTEDATVLTDCDFLHNAAVAGGAVAVSKGFSATTCSFTENRAYMGGAVFFTDWVFIQGKQFLHLRNSLILKNRARAGGGVFIDGKNFTEDRIEIVADDNEIELPAVKSHNCDILTNCDISVEAVSENVAEAYGDDWATSSSGYCVLLLRPDGRREAAIWNGETMDDIVRKGYNEYPQLQIQMHDAFLQGPAFTNEELTSVANEASDQTPMYTEPLAQLLVPKSENASRRFIQSDLLIGVTSGIANFTIGVPFISHGTYELIARTENFMEYSTRLLVHIDECTTGEERKDEGSRSYCQKCESGQYSFVSDEPSICRSCPIRANCSSRFILPDDGYWNSMPCSPHVQTCLNKEVCRASSRLQSVDDGYTWTRCKNTTEKVNEYRASECEEYYEGPLCGSCSSESGSFGFANCHRCISKAVAPLAIIAILLYQLTLAFIQIQGTSSSDVEDSIRINSLTLRRSTAIVERNENIEFFAASGLRSIVPSANIPDLHFTTEQKKDAAVRAQYGVMEFFKILINFIQMIATAGAQDVSWLRPIPRLFQTFDGIGSMFEFPLSFALDCSLSNDSSTPRSIVRQIIAHFMPAFLLSVITLVSALEAMLSGRSRAHFGRGLVLATIIVLYNSYFSITKTALDTFNCIEIYDGLDLETLDSRNLYWALDTSIKCYESSHLTLVLFSSINLLIFTVAFPIVVAATLLRFGRDDDLYKSKKFQETMGFLFTGYTKDFIFWDSVILARKAIISCILTFSYRLDSGLQSSYICLVFILSSFTQTYFDPFRKDVCGLNSAESMSIAAGAITFLCSIVINTPEFESELNKQVGATVLVMVDLGVFSFLTFCVAKQKLHQMRMDLEADHVGFGSGTVYEVVRKYCAKQANEVLASVQDFGQNLSTTFGFRGNHGYDRFVDSEDPDDPPHLSDSEE